MDGKKGMQELAFKAADLDNDGLLNRSEYEHFYSLWMEKFLEDDSDMCMPERGSEFYERHYELLN